MNHLPPEILNIVLQNLSVPDLLQASCVSRTWRHAVHEVLDVPTTRLRVPLRRVEQVRMYLHHAKITPIFTVDEMNQMWQVNPLFNGFQEFLLYNHKKPFEMNNNTLIFPLRIFFSDPDAFECLSVEEVNGLKMVNVRTTPSQWLQSAWVDGKWVVGDDGTMLSELRG